MPRLRGRTVALVVLLTLLWPAVALGQASKAGVVTTLEGNVTAARAALPQPVALKFKDDVFLNDRIVTGDRSIARLLLGGKAVVTVRERSALTITEVPGRSTIDLDSGKIAVAVARERMRAGESIEVRTPNAVAAVRGTVFVAEVTQATAALEAAQAAVTTNIYGFAGQILVTFLGQLFTLGPDMFLSGTGFQPPTVGTMTADMRSQALAGLQTKAQQVGGAGQEGAKDQAVGTTVATFTAAVPPEVVTPSPAPQAVSPPAPKPQEAPILPGGSQVLTTSSPAGANLVVNGGFETGDFTGWTLTGAGSVITQFGTLTPPGGSYFALLHTNTGQTPLAGCGSGKACTRSTLSQSFNVNSVLTLKGGGWGLSNEYPDFTGSQSIFDDHLVIDLVDSSGTTFTLYEKNVNDLHDQFTASSSSVTAGSFTLSSGAGVTEFTLGSKTVVVAAGSVTLEITVENISDSLFHSALLFDNVIATQDPPLFFIRDGATFTRTGSTPLLRLTNDARTFDSLLMVCCDATATLDGPILEATDSTLDVPFSLVSVLQGGTLTSTSTSPLVRLQGGTYSLGADVAIFDIAGVNKAFDPATGLTLGTDEPLRHGGVLLDASGAAITTRTALQVDTALLEATAPLLNLAKGSALTTSGHAIDLAGQARVSIPNDAVAMISLNASTFSVTNGHLVNVAGGSVLNVAGSLVSLANGSTLNVLNGLLLNVGGGSVATIGKSLVSFSGTGNALNVTNNLVPTALIGGIPVYAPANSFQVTSATPLAGLGTAGTIKVNGVSLTPTTPLASLKGSLVAVGSGGSVKIGP